MAPKGSPCFELTPYGWMQKIGDSVARIAQPIGFAVDRRAVADLSLLEAARDRTLLEFTTFSFPEDVRYLETEGRPVAVLTAAGGQLTATALDDLERDCGPVSQVLERGREVDGLTFLKMVAQVDERRCPFRQLLSQ